LSIGAREWLAEHRLGWVDEIGRASISLPSGLVVFRDVADPPQSIPNDRWSQSTVAVAEAVLSGIDPAIDSVQTATGLSRGAAAKALSMMERNGFLHRDTKHGPGSSRHLLDADELLGEYAKAVAALRAKTKPVLLHRLWRDPIDALVSEIAPALDLLDATWAATGATAAALMAPYLSGLTVIELYVDAETLSNRSTLCEALGARQVARGHRIEVTALPNRFIASAGPVLNGVRCAPPLRVFADLAARGGRSAEAAQHLKETLHVGTAT
jgi:Transcriptional regulator, AbiEi antitoxin, Type IV TA system